MQTAEEHLGLHLVSSSLPDLLQGLPIYHGKDHDKD